MYKIVLLIKRKEGLSKQEFEDYYESNHAPLAKRVMPGMCAYKRTFLEPLSTSQSSPTDFDLEQHSPFSEYDVVTEFYWSDAENFQKAVEFMNSDAAQVLVEDELKFMDRPSMTFFMGKECSTDFS